MFDTKRLVTIALHTAIATATIVLHVACGGGSTGAPPANTAADAKEPKGEAKESPKDEVATGSTLTEFQKKRLLGHYSTLNGQSGFILDRTVTPWRAKLDGVNKVVTMSESNTPRRGQKEYTADDKSIWIRIDEESGEVLLFQGPKQHEGVDIRRDADANQLK